MTPAEPQDRTLSPDGAIHGCRPKCKACLNEQSRRYSQEHPHRGWASTYRTRMREIGLVPVVEEFTKDDVIARYGTGCSYCDSGAFEQLDHFIPLIAGGHHTLENVRPSCRSCNTAKSKSEKPRQPKAPRRKRKMSLS